MSVVLVSGGICSKERGPYEGSATWEKEKAAADELKVVASRLREIPMLYAMVPGVLRDRSENPMDVTPAIAETIASEVAGQGWLHAKPRRVATTR